MNSTRTRLILPMALFFISALTLVAPSFSAVSTATTYQVTLVRGSTTVQTFSAVSPDAVWLACQNEANRLARAATQTSGSVTYRCQTERWQLVASYSPSPTPVDCVVSDWSGWTGGTWSACANGTQTRQETRTRTVVTQPANGGAACPVLTETRTATQPCTAPPTADWVHCANQDERCSFSGTQRVRYGIDTRWIEGTFTGGVDCNNGAMEGNPAPGARKTCQIRGTAQPPPPPATGSAVVTWTAPTHNTDGSALTGLTGYRVHYGRSATDLSQIVNASGTSLTVNALSAGTWYFGVTALTARGESAVSALASKVIQ